MGNDYVNIKFCAKCPHCEAINEKKDNLNSYYIYFVAVEIHIQNTLLTDLTLGRLVGNAPVPSAPF